MSPQLRLSPETLAERESANGLRQIDRAVDIIYDSLEPERRFFLSPSLILHLQMIAVDGIRDDGGQWRTGDAVISGSRHILTRAHLVPLLMKKMCDFINNNFHEETAFWLSAFVMWRLNWIHLFADGNGRSART